MAGPLNLMFSFLLMTSCLGFLKASGEEVHRVVREAYLMGTKASLEIYSVDRVDGLGQLEAFMGILEQTEAELSNWREDSAISLLNASPPGIDFPLSPGMCRLFGDLVALHELSDGRFDPAIGRLLTVWGIRDSTTVPAAGELARALAFSGLRQIKFSPETCLVTRRTAVLLDAGAFGKGAALEKVRVYSEKTQADPWLINFGGQVAVYSLPPGADSWQVDVSSPVDRERRCISVRLVRGSLATSGNSERSRSADGVEIGHILNPVTGWPSGFTGSVTVWHEDALTADALATALHVMGPEEGLPWASSHQIAACFILVPETGPLEIKRNRCFDPLVSF